jgi:hypothetical protein
MGLLAEWIGYASLCACRIEGDVPSPGSVLMAGAGARARARAGARALAGAGGT